ncbi:MAG: hypothetical protein ABI190_10770 [Casimicrobiaceae bacterium]
MRTLQMVVALACAVLQASAFAGVAECPAALPAQGAALRAVQPLFPADNWWNADVSTAPVDAQSAGFIAYINNGGVRRLHPDFGGVAEGNEIYGMPYAVVGTAQPKLAVQFGYADESDGVDPASGRSLPFYPIPAQAITQPHWIEGGAPGNVDQRDDADRHLLLIDCANNALYELYNVFYDSAGGGWHAGSGAYFDMNADVRRPDGWTSADAAGLAIFPGLLRYDEAWNADVADIGHALRVTLRATNGYVFPASHRAGSTAGALPMGARLRLKTSVAGSDPALRSSDPNVRKIFHAMQHYGLIVADNGADMYIGGTFDTRWNNDLLNPAFAQLAASDFDVVQLGWRPAVVPPPPPPPPANGVIAVVEYRYPPWDHYFMTAFDNEIDALDRGLFPGWVRTGRTFNAWPLSSATGAVVCRYFSTSFAPRSSHFYSAFSDECSVLQHNPDWQFETEAFRVQLPGADGSCAAPTMPLFRMYNNGQGGAPNHRYTTDIGVRATMLAAGWIAEGRGTIGVSGCVAP